MSGEENKSDLTEADINELYQVDPLVQDVQKQQRILGKQGALYNQIGDALQTQQRLQGALDPDRPNPELALDLLDDLYLQLISLQVKLQHFPEELKNTDQYKKLTSKIMAKLEQLTGKDGKENAYLKAIKLFHDQRKTMDGMREVRDRTSANYLATRVQDYRGFDSRIASSETLYKEGKVSR